MVALFLLFGYTVLAVVFLMLATIGYRGTAVDHFLGYEIPHHVRDDPTLLAAYTFTVTAIATYPFEEIKHLA